MSMTYTTFYPPSQSDYVTLTLESNEDRHLWRLLKDNTSDAYFIYNPVYHSFLYSNPYYKNRFDRKYIAAFPIGNVNMSDPQLDVFRFYLEPHGDGVFSIYSKSVGQGWNTKYGHKVLTYMNDNENHVIFNGSLWGGYIDNTGRYKITVVPDTSYVKIMNVHTSRFLKNNYSPSENFWSVLGDFFSNPISFGTGLFSNIVDALLEAGDILLNIVGLPIDQVKSRVPEIVQTLTTNIKNSIDTTLLNDTRLRGETHISIPNTSDLLYIYILVFAMFIFILIYMAYRGMVKLTSSS